MSSEGFLIGIDLHVRLKLCIFLMIFTKWIYRSIESRPFYS